MNAKQLAEMRQVEIGTVDINELVDISAVKIDEAAPVAVRLEQYIDGLKNPYAFRVGDIAVKATFSKNDKTINDAIRNYLTGLRDSE